MMLCKALELIRFMSNPLPFTTPTRQEYFNNLALKIKLIEKLREEFDALQLFDNFPDKISKYLVESDNKLDSVFRELISSARLIKHAIAKEAQAEAQGQG